MYQFLDRRLDELGVPAGFLLGAMRLWVTSVQAGRCRCQATTARFDAAGLGTVADDFGMAMFTLNADGLQRLHFAPSGCPHVRDDEARLLALFKVGVDQNPAALRQLSAALVDEAAIARLMQAVSLVAGPIAASLVSTPFD